MLLSDHSSSNFSGRLAFQLSSQVRSEAPFFFTRPPSSPCLSPYHENRSVLEYCYLSHRSNEVKHLPSYGGHFHTVATLRGKFSDVRCPKDKCLSTYGHLEHLLNVFSYVMNTYSYICLLLVEMPGR